MTEGGDTAPCFSCGAVVPETDGPTHDYMLSTPGCWSVFGKVLARQYQDPAFMRGHRPAVDAYAVQHPGEPTPAARRSVLFHLISLCAMEEHGIGPHRATGIIQEMAERDLDPPWLEPPDDLGEVTVADAYGVDDPESHLACVRRWARSAWEAWAPHHGIVRRRLEALR